MIDLEFLKINDIFIGVIPAFLRLNADQIDIRRQACLFIDPCRRSRCAIQIHLARLDQNGLAARIMPVKSDNRSAKVRILLGEIADTRSIEHQRCLCALGIGRRILLIELVDDPAFLKLDMRRKLVAIDARRNGDPVLGRSLRRYKIRQRELLIAVAVKCNGVCTGSSVKHRLNLFGLSCKAACQRQRWFRAKTGDCDRGLAPRAFAVRGVLCVAVLEVVIHQAVVVGIPCGSRSFHIAFPDRVFVDPVVIEAELECARLRLVHKKHGVGLKFDIRAEAILRKLERHILLAVQRTVFTGIEEPVAVIGQPALCQLVIVRIASAVIALRIAGVEIVLNASRPTECLNICHAQNILAGRILRHLGQRRDRTVATGRVSHHGRSVVFTLVGAGRTAVAIKRVKQAVGGI